MASVVQTEEDNRRCPLDKFPSTRWRSLFPQHVFAGIRWIVGYRVDSLVFTSDWNTRESLLHRKNGPSTNGSRYSLFRCLCWFQFPWRKTLLLVFASQVKTIMTSLLRADLGRLEASHSSYVPISHSRPTSKQDRWSTIFSTTEQSTINHGSKVIMYLGVTVLLTFLVISYLHVWVEGRKLAYFRLEPFSETFKWKNNNNDYQGKIIQESKTDNK